MIEFETPAAFFSLLWIPLLFFLRKLNYLSPLSFPLTLSDWGGEKFRWESPFRRFFSGFSTFLCYSGFFCIVLAASSPVINHQEKVFSSRGADILFVVDISPSMACRDIAGESRLASAKNAIHLLQSDELGASLGLVSLAKETYLTVPPTMDRTTFFDSLDNLQIGSLGDGTAIGDGLCSAIMHLESSSAPNKCIVLITDGENNAGVISPNTAANLAKQKGISLYVLGIGSKGTVPLEYTDPLTGRFVSGYLETNYDVAALSQIALAADGKFFEIDNINSLIQVLEAVTKNENVSQSYYLRNTEKRYYDMLIVISLILFLLAFFVKRVCLQEVL